MPKIKAQSQPYQSTGRSDIDYIEYGRYTITLPIEIKQLADKIAKKERRTFSNFLAVLIENYANKSVSSKNCQTQEKWQFFMYLICIEDLSYLLWNLNRKMLRLFFRFFLNSVRPGNAV